MFVVGLTGGIGTGKTTFAALLLERGAQVIDADALGRDALRPGEPAWHSVVDQFGKEVLVHPSMEIDRRRVAELVFNDPEALKALNAIVHPVIFKSVADELDRLRSSDAIVVLDAALVVETALADVCDAVIVMDSTDDERIRRLQHDRGMSVPDIKARMTSQSDREVLLGRADIVVRNDGTSEDLAREADRVWKRLLEMRGSRG
ncbi:MAG TPA: dephospho-CoA kinase [Actinomycetota bacterium]|jgi:dephospho-CoA kinase|nr:dephospho-CoA kinase [Actinomycetota bacterium]